MIYGHPTTPDRAHEIADDLRQSDKDEVWASGGYDPLTALKRSMEASETPMGIFNDHGLVGAFGVVHSGAPLVGIVWLLATPAIERGSDALCFLRESRKHIDRMNHEFPVLTNFVDERNTSSLRWLTWLGARFPARHERHGYEQRPFWKFVRTRTMNHV